MTEQENIRFSQLCAEDRVLHGKDADSIGTYNEKRLHRILKRYITDCAECYEIKSGRYVADVLKEGKVYEIQTGPFGTLAKKIEYYLTQTEYAVEIVFPVICQKTVVRIDAQTGEVLRKKRSPKKETELYAAANMYYLQKFVGHPRFCLHTVMITAEEYRFSEAVRYRRSGRYDHDLFPVEMLGEHIFKNADDFASLLPDIDGEFDAPHFSLQTGLKNRKLYSALNFFCGIGSLEKRSEGRKNFYRISKK